MLCLRIECFKNSPILLKLTFCRPLAVDCLPIRVGMAGLEIALEVPANLIPTARIFISALGAGSHGLWRGRHLLDS